MAKNTTETNVSETTAADSTANQPSAAAQIKGLMESTDSDRIEAIKAPMGGRVRKVFDSYSEAKAAFDKAVAAAAGTIPAHSTPEETFPEGTRAAVAVVGQRKRVGSKFETGIKGLVMFPMPSAQGFIDEARDWIEKIIEKEAAHIAFRRIRGAETYGEFASGFSEIPLDVNAYVTQYNTGDGLDTETFDAIWSPLRAGLKEALPALAALLPQKAEVLKAIRSASYAREEHSELEAKGVFVFLANSAIQGAEGFKDAEGNATPLDASAIKEWIAKRDEVTLATRKVEKDFSALDSIDLGLAMEAGSDDEG